MRKTASERWLDGDDLDFQEDADVGEEIELESIDIGKFIHQTDVSKATHTF